MKKVSIIFLIIQAIGYLSIMDLKADEKSSPLPQEKRLKNIRQLTFDGKNAEAYFSFDGTKLIFQATRNGFQCDQIFIMYVDGSDISSNLHQPGGRGFNLYLINIDGTGLERITFHSGFDAFPMFSPDGKRLVFISNRNAKQPGEFNIFMADWVP